MAIFTSKLLVYQRVPQWVSALCPAYSGPSIGCQFEGLAILCHRRQDHQLVFQRRALAVGIRGDQNVS